MPILQIQFHAKGPGGNVAVVNASMYQVTAAVASPQSRAGRSRSLLYSCLARAADTVCCLNHLSQCAVPAAERKILG